MPIDFEEPTEPVEPVIEPTAAETKAEFEARTKAEQIVLLKEKYLEYPTYVALKDTEKVDVLIGAHIAELEAKSLEEKRVTFQQVKAAALESQRIAGLAEIEITRVKVYKEKLALEQEWSNSAGTWDLP